MSFAPDLLDALGQGCIVFVVAMGGVRAWKCAWMPMQLAPFALRQELDAAAHVSSNLLKVTTPLALAVWNFAIPKAVTKTIRDKAGSAFGK
jgi:hypothetical protein